MFVESLPIAGVDGTMRNRLTNQPVNGNAHIKTGTLRDVRAIAGYVASADGVSYVVVSFINDPACRSRARGARRVARMGLPGPLRRCDGTGSGIRAANPGKTREAAKPIEVSF